MTTAIRLRHVNRTGLQHLSAAAARHEEAATRPGPPDHTWPPRPRLRRRPPATLSPRSAARTERPRAGRHDLLPTGTGQAVCTDCGCVFELPACVEGGRRLPLCQATPAPPSLAP